MDDKPHEHIWLQWDGTEVTWCHNMIHDTDVEYVIREKYQQSLVALTYSREQCHEMEDQIAHLQAENARLEADNIRLRQDRADALNLKSRDGLLSSEWLLRTGIAERKQAESESENQRLLEWLDKCIDYINLITFDESPGLEWFNEIKAALAADKEDHE